MKQNIITEYNSISSTHKISLNRDDFHQFINGLYQAEGTMGAYFPNREKLNIAFYFSVGQNYSPEALDVLLHLQKFLGIGKIKLEFGIKGIAHIRYIVTNREDIYNIVIPYFSLLYGHKSKDRVVLKRIYELSLHKLDDASVSELIHLVYSINPWGQKRKLTLTEKLSIFNCSLSTNYNPLVGYNNNLPSKLFIIGLFLGDGSIGFVFNSPPSRLPKFYIKIVFNFAAQNSNIELLKLIAESMNLKPQISRRKSGMMGLEYSGETVFKYIMPFLTEHKDWLFWRKDQFINAQKVAIIFKNKDHLTKDGLSMIVDLLYSRPNKYIRPKEYWIDLINKHIWK